MIAELCHGFLHVLTLTLSTLLFHSLLLLMNYGLGFILYTGQNLPVNVPIQREVARGRNIGDKEEEEEENLKPVINNQTQNRDQDLRNQGLKEKILNKLRYREFSRCH